MADLLPFRPRRPNRIDGIFPALVERPTIGQLAGLERVTPTERPWPWWVWSLLALVSAAILFGAGVQFGMALASDPTTKEVSHDR